MKKGIKGSLFVILYVLLSYLTQFIVLVGASVIGTLKIVPGLNLTEPEDMNALNESLSLWITEYNAQILIISNLLLLGILFLILHLRKIPLKKRLGNGRLTWRNTGASVVLLIGSGIFVSLFLSLPFLAPHMEEHNALMNSLTAGNPIFVLLLVCILGPIVEEFTFRGMIYKELKTFLPVWLSVLLSALLFGLWHGSIVQGTYAFFLGIILAAAYEKTDSFAVPVLMHILFNTFNFIPTLIWEQSPGLSTVLIGVLLVRLGWKLLRKKEA